MSEENAENTPQLQPIFGAFVVIVTEKGQRPMVAILPKDKIEALGYQARSEAIDQDDILEALLTVSEYLKMNISAMIQLRTVHEFSKQVKASKPLIEVPGKH